MVPGLRERDLDQTWAQGEITREVTDEAFGYLATIGEKGWALRGKQMITLFKAFGQYGSLPTNIRASFKRPDYLFRVVPSFFADATTPDRMRNRVTALATVFTTKKKR